MTPARPHRGLRAGLLLLWALALGALLAGVPTGGPARAAHAIAPDDAIAITNAAEWCEAAPELDVAAIAAGGCRFAPADARAMARGYSKAVYWLRLSLKNPGAAPVERLLQIGHRRLERVAFFEAAPEGAWRRAESGLAVARAERPYIASDPILPLRLEPGETREIYVRAASRTSINLTPTLWRERAYAEAANRFELEQAAAIGGILVAAMFSLLMATANFFSQWSARANLYLAGGLVAKALFNAANTGLLPLYFLPAEQGLDLRVQAGALGLSSIFFALFVMHFVAARKNYPVSHGVLRAAIAALFAATVWSLLIDYSSGFRALMFTGMLMMAFCCALLFRAWRDRLPGAGFLLVSQSINLGVFAHRIALALAGGFFNDTLVTAYSWTFLLTTPLLPLGIALHERTLSRALETARKENEARLAFLAQMSHELRTPLDTILGNAQLLSRPGATPALRAEGLAAIQDSGRRLLRMIDDILDHARGLAGRLTIRPAPVDWPSFLRGVAVDGQTLATRQGNVFTLRQEGDAPGAVDVDAGRLRQILDNLLANAARHTRGGAIELACAAKADKGGYWLDLRVTDTGEGVAPEDLERIFLPFERGGGKNARRGDKGLGMGLTISRQLAHMMGGGLTVTSQPGRGACFRLRIRAAAAEALFARAGAALSRPAAARNKLLLVDDESDNRRALAAFLRDSGFEVLEANSGAAAIGLLAATDVDLVLTDQFMADGDGWMVLRGARRLRPEAAVVSISAAPLDPPPGTRTRFDMSFLKPLDHASLLQGVADLLGLDLDGGAPAAPPPQPAPPAETAARPDAAAMADLRRMIGDGQVSEIMAWAEARKKRQPACAAFADEVAAAALRLDFDRLNALAGATGMSAS